MNLGYGGQSPQIIRFKLSMWFVYILKCSDGTSYTGCTSNLDARITRHNKGENTYTKVRLPVKLITYIAFQNKYKAYEFEKYLKPGSGRAFTKKRFSINLISKPPSQFNEPPSPAEALA